MSKKRGDHEKVIREKILVYVVTLIGIDFFVDVWVLQKREFFKLRSIFFG